MQINSIQYLRGIAALMVAVFHLAPQIERMHLPRPPAGWLMSGVDIFFVISGFIMWWTTRGSDIAPARFMQRRIRRVVPLYWALTGFYVVVLLVAPRLTQSSALDWWHAVASFLFLPYDHPVHQRNLPLVAPGWTLNYEMFFYCIFAVSLLLPTRSRLMALVVALTGLVAFGTLFQPTSLFGRFYTSSLLLEFLFGVLLAVLIDRGKLIPERFVIPCLVVAVAALSMSEGLAWEDARALRVGVPAALVVYAAVSFERQRRLPRWPVLLLLGNASYSLYLSQQITLSATGQAWRTVFSGAHWWSAAGFAFVGTAVAIAAGLVCYFCLELPLGRMTRRFLVSPRRQPELAPVRVRGPVPTDAS